MMIPKVSSLFLSEPADTDWRNRNQWDKVVGSLRIQHPNITAFESKAVYVFGMMRHLLEAAGWELAHFASVPRNQTAATIFDCLPTRLRRC